MIIYFIYFVCTVKEIVLSMYFYIFKSALIHIQGANIEEKVETTQRNVRVSDPWKPKNHFDQTLDKDTENQTKKKQVIYSIGVCFFSSSFKCITIDVRYITQALRVSFTFILRRTCVILSAVH